MLDACDNLLKVESFFVWYRIFKITVKLNYTAETLLIQVAFWEGNEEYYFIGKKF